MKGPALGICIMTDASGFVAEPCAGNAVLSRAVENRPGEAEPDLPVVGIDRAAAHRKLLFVHIPTLAHRTGWVVLFCRWECDPDRVSAPVENGSRHLRFAGYDPALCDEEDDHVPRTRHRGILLSRLASAAGGSL